MRPPPETTTSRGWRREFGTSTQLRAQLGGWGVVSDDSGREAAPRCPQPLWGTFVLLE